MIPSPPSRERLMASITHYMLCVACIYPWWALLHIYINTMKYSSCYACFISYLYTHMGSVVLDSFWNVDTHRNAITNNSSGGISRDVHKILKLTIGIISDQDKVIRKCDTSCWKLFTNRVIDWTVSGDSQCCSYVFSICFHTIHFLPLLCRQWPSAIFSNDTKFLCNSFEMWLVFFFSMWSCGKELRIKIVCAQPFRSPGNWYVILCWAAEFNFWW